MKRGVLIIFVAILIPCLLQAQTTPNDPQRLTLEQAVNFAVEHNKELQASQMNIELRNKMVTEAISQGLPQINGDLNYSTNFRYKMSFPGSESSTVLKDQSSVGVTVNQLLFSGEWILGIQTSKIAKLIASQQVDVTELDIKETVYNSYYTILVSERLMEIVKLIGSDVLPDDQKLVLEIARVIRLGFLQQNAFHKDDTCVSLQKQYKMMEIILYLYKRCRELVAMNMPMSVLKEENIFERVIAIKYDVPNDNLQLLDQYLADIDAFHDHIMEKNA